MLKDKTPNLTEIKKNLFRTKHQVMVKMGKSEHTVDTEYKQEREKFDERNRQLKDLEKSLARYEKAISEVTSAQHELYTKFQIFFDPTTSLYQTSQLSGRIASDIDVAQQAFQESTNERVRMPLQELLILYKTMDRRCVERARRLQDKDRYSQDLASYQAKEQKGEVDHAKLHQLKEKSENMNLGYSALNQEIMDDFSHLDLNKNRSVDSLFASFVDGQSLYFKKSLEGIQTLENGLQDVDRNLALRVRQIITPEEDSLYKKPVEVVAEMLHSGSTSQQGYPSQTGAPQSAVPSVPHSAPPPLPSQMLRCKGLYPFKGAEAGELPFQPGDVMIIHNQYGDWWEVELNGQRGIIPANYVTII